MDAETGFEPVPATFKASGATVTPLCNGADDECCPRYLPLDRRAARCLPSPAYSVVKVGAEGWIRTSGLRCFKPVLYQAELPQRLLTMVPSEGFEPPLYEV